jgi:hypothetical protein
LFLVLKREVEYPRITENFIMDRNVDLGQIVTLTFNSSGG